MALAGRMKLELEDRRTAEELFLRAQNPLGALWLGELHSGGELPERSQEWWADHAKKKNLVAAYVLGQLSQRTGGLGLAESCALLEPPIIL